LLAGGQETAFRGGDTILLPAGLAQTVITTDADSLWLEVTIKGNA
jgi:uncharacterized protein YjlB